VVRRELLRYCHAEILFHEGVECTEMNKLRLHEASRKTSQEGRLPVLSYLQRVNAYLPEIRTCLQTD
jgi:hypothetical protein